MSIVEYIQKGGGRRPFSKKTCSINGVLFCRFACLNTEPFEFVAVWLSNGKAKLPRSRILYNLQQ